MTLESPEGIQITGIADNEFSGAENGQTDFPEQLNASLNIAFTLDPSSTVSLSNNEYATVLEGDTITIVLPDGFTASSASPIEVFQCDAQGEPTSIKIATAVVSESALVITFQQPIDTQSGQMYTVGSNEQVDQIAATATEKPQWVSDSGSIYNLEALSANLDIPVVLASSLLSEEDSCEIVWTLQSDASDGSQQTAILILPSKQDIAATLGIEVVDDAQNEESAIGIAGISLFSSNDQSRIDDTWTETKRTPGNGDTSLTLFTSWCDSNNALGLRPSLDTQQQDYAVTFTIEGSEYSFTEENAFKYLGIDSTTVGDLCAIDFSETGVGYTQAIIDDLPSSVTITYQKQQIGVNGQPVYDDTGQPVYDTTTEEQSVAWKLTDTKKDAYGTTGTQDSDAYVNYARYGGTGSTVDASDGSVSSSGAGSFEATQYMQVLQEIDYTISLKIGDLEADLDSLGIEENLVFRAYVNNTLVDEAYELSSIVNDHYLSYGQVQQSGLVKNLTISGRLPVYDIQNRTLVYCLSYNEDNPQLKPYENVDDYLVTYNNQASVNHGTATDACYPNGTMFLTHVGSTTFSATKAWLDGDNAENRPEITFTLWRYSPDGATSGTAQTAAQVSTSDGQFVIIKVPAQSGSQDGLVDIGALLKEQYPDLVLDKYDTDGFPYVYGIKEMGSVEGYTSILGSVDLTTGNVTDTVPNYFNEDASSKVVTNASWGSDSRPSVDCLVYNGGTLSNRLSGSVSVEQTKTWIVAAFQDQLQDVTCTFTLQQREKGSSGAWENATVDGTTDGEIITKTIEGFKAESLTQNISGSYSKYGRGGEELEYRWVESNVTQGGQNTNFVRDDNSNTATFELSFELPEGGGTENLTFTSSIDEDTGYIVNTFANTTEQYVDKYWQNEEGTYSQNRPDPRYYNTNATIKLFQDDVLVGTFTMTGEDLLNIDFNGQNDGYTIEGLADGEYVHVDETASYHLEFTNLPKYSPTGHRYIYLVIEESVEGWTSSRVYHPDQKLTEIYNAIPVGEGTQLAVSKKWIDGDDAQHRLNSVVGVYAAHDMFSDAQNPNGTPVTSYEEGQLVNTVVLSEENAWYTEFAVGIGGLSYNDFNFVELGLTSGTDPNNIMYPSMTHDQANEAKNAAVNQDDWNWVNDHWTRDNCRIATDEHVYEVGDSRWGGSFNEDKNAYEVTNRRLGLVDFDITKTWYDTLGDIEQDADNPRPAANLVLSCTSQEGVFTVENSTLYIQLNGGNKHAVQILDKSGAAIEGISLRNDGTVIIPVDTSLETSNYQIIGLPKYDGDGLLASYAVNEEWAGAPGEYVSSSDAGTYEVGKRHYQDSQECSFSNRRSGVTDIQFHKEWKDVYVKATLNQRPDIYLTLYKVSQDTGGQPVQVDGYIDYLWTANDPNAVYSQTCDISGLPKYDSVGDEITYYATESMASTGELLDYVPVTFSFTEGLPNDNQPLAWSLGLNLKVTDEAQLAKLSGSTIALHEGGTFTNKLEGTVVAQGEKLWQNVPSGFPLADLPDITIFLQQRVAGENWPDLYVTINDDGTVALNADKSKDGAIAWTRLEANNSSTLYTYQLSREGDNSNLVVDGEGFPRYTDNGELIEYRAREIMGGLAGKPGSVEANEFANTNFASDDYTPTDGKVYSIAHGIVGSFKINNIYESDKGSLTVKKIFDGRSADDHYPDVTYTVERSHNGQDPWQYVTEHTITADEFNKVAESSGNATLSYTFEDLDVYAPDGEEWIYRIVESSIDGYTTYAATGDLSLDQVKQNGSVSNTVTDLKADLRGTTNGVPTGEYDTTPDATFANTYVPDQAKLKGLKQWNDYENAFGNRPTPDKLSLTLTRSSASGQTETLFENQKTQEDNNFTIVLGDSKSLTFTWVETGEASGQWSYEITGEAIERYAPDGSLWTYTLTEAAIDSDYYRAQTATATAQANEDPQGTSVATGSFNALKNELKGSAQVIKNWNDGENPYGLRPTSVTVQLQARYSQDSGESWSDWKSANSAFEELSRKEDLIADSVDLNASDNWQHSWTSLPVVASIDEANYQFEYRVIETKIGDVDVDVDSGATEEDGLYASQITKSYTTTQTTTSSENAYVSTITNALEHTSVSVTKAWSDSDNQWNLRPLSATVGGQWSVKYYLMSATGDNPQAGDFAFVAQADKTFVGSSPVDQMEDPGFESAVVKGVVEGSLDLQEGTFNTNTVTFNYLPKYSDDGNQITYAWAEEVPFGYTADQASTLGKNQSGHSVVLVTAGSTMSYSNVLDTVSLEGAKTWNDYETELAPAYDDSNVPSMTLYRQVSGGATETVSGVTPTWAQNEKDEWIFTYSDLPKTDSANNQYTYWAEEVAGSGAAAGFYPTYASGSSQYNESDEKWTNREITNVATRFTLNKIDDKTNPVDLNNIELSILSSDKSKVYAVWTRDNAGTVKSYVWKDGADVSSVWSDGALGQGDLTTTGATEMTGDNAGYIVGLKQGNYVVSETGDVPEYHALASDVALTITAQGVVSTNPSNALSVVGANPGGTVTVTLVDPVFRAHIELTKTLGNTDALEGATFALYRQGGSSPNPETDTKIAENLVTGSDGKWSSRDDGSNVQFLAGNGDGRTYLSDGLLPGTYYFVETGFPDSAHEPDNQVISSAVTIAQIPSAGQYGHGSTATISLDNVAFDADITVKKFDSSNNAGIENAQFTLEKQNDDGDTWSTINSNLLTDSEGTLTINISAKGTYRLTETANAGYENSGFTATFTVANEHHGKTFDLTKSDDCIALDWNVTQGTFINDQGISNDRLTGNVKMFKTSSVGAVGGLNGAVFTLQKKTDNGSWVNVVAGLETGYTYKLNSENTALDGSGAVGDSGYILVDNLLWGTYRFLETSSSDGYVLQTGTISNEFTIDRMHLTGELTGSNSVVNTPTNIVIRKQDENGKTLTGATFTVTPQEGSSFVDGSTQAKQMTAVNGTYSLSAQMKVSNTYEVRETTAPSGYVSISGALVVTVQDDGTLSVVGDMPEGYSQSTTGPSETNKYTFIAQNTPIRLQIDKVDQNNNPLTGATFVLSGKCTDNKTYHELVLGEDSEAWLEGQLINGESYEIYESSAPLGYKTLAGSVKFTVDASGLFTDVTADKGYYIEASDDQRSAFIKVTVQDEPISLSLRKIAEGNQTPLTGAVFSIVPEQGSTFADGTDAAISLRTEGQNGETILNGKLICGGTYTITESHAPDGYEAVETALTIAVDEQGEISIVGTPPEGWTQETTNGFVATLTDTPIEAQLAKFSLETGEALAGAEFKVTGKFADGTESKSLVVGDNGVATFESAQLIGGEIYTIKEIKAPEGYELIETEWQFKVNENGTLGAVSEPAVDGAQGYRIANEGLQILAYDNPVTLTLYKLLADDNNPLVGATFEVTGRFANGEAKETKTFTTTAPNGTFEITAQLVVGESYSIKEIDALSSNELISGTLTFTVNADGTVSPVGEVPAGYAISENAVELTATNTSIQVTLSKVNLDGELMAGAIFELYEGSGSDKVPIANVSSSNEGSVDLVGMKRGTTYTLIESVAPAGYELHAEPFVFTVADDGTISTTSTDSAYAVKHENGIEAIMLIDEPIEVEIEKISVVGEALEGATLSIVPEQGSTFADGSTQARSYTTNAWGKVPIGSAQLLAGNVYVITETVAPQGCVPLEDSWRFEVVEDGTLLGTATTDGSVAGYLIKNDQTDTITVVNDCIPGSKSPKTSDRLPFALLAGLVGASLVSLGFAVTGFVRSRRNRRLQ